MTRYVIVGAGPVGFHLGRELGLRSRVLFSDTCARVSKSIRALGHSTVEPPLGVFAWRADDIVILATKATAAVAAVEPIPERVPVVCVSNGLNPALREARPGQVSFATVDFAVSRDAAGAIVCTRRGRLTLPRSSARRATERLAASLAGSSVRASLTSDIEPHLWSKLLLNASLDAVAALTGQTLGEVFGHAESFEAFRRLLREGIAVLRAARIPPRTVQGITPLLLDRVVHWPVAARVAALLARRSALRVESSMLGDLRRGEPTEIEYLNGRIVEVAEELGLDARGHRRTIDVCRDMEAGLIAPGLEAAQLLEVRRAPTSAPAMAASPRERSRPRRARFRGPPIAATHAERSARPSSRPTSGA
jgi:2-dehydropantoate 2-reductase